MIKETKIWASSCLNVDWLFSLGFYLLNVFAVPLHFLFFYLHLFFQFARADLKNPAGAEPRRGSRVRVFRGLIEPNRWRDGTFLITLHQRNIPSSHSNRQPSAMISFVKWFLTSNYPCLVILRKALARGANWSGEFSANFQLWWQMNLIWRLKSSRCFISENDNK